MHWVFCLLLCVTACVRSSLETQTVRSLLLYTCKPWKSDIFANSLHKHIWLYAFTTLDRPVSVSQKCTDLCADNFEINLIGQLPVALEAGSVLSRVALWGWFENKFWPSFFSCATAMQFETKPTQSSRSPKMSSLSKVVYAGPYVKTAPLAVSILFNENVLILCSYIICIYINIQMQF